MADDLGAKVGNIHYVGGTYKKVGGRGQGFYHDGHGEHRFKVSDSVAADGSGMRPLLIKILKEMQEVDPLRHEQAAACLKFVAKKSAAEKRDIYQKLAYTDPGTVKGVAPLVQKIQDFNSLDLAVKCRTRIDAFRAGVIDCIMGDKNQETFVSYLGAFLLYQPHS